MSDQRIALRFCGALKTSRAPSGSTLRAALLILAIVSFHLDKRAAADEPRAAGITPVAYSGKVFDADGKPLSDAEVFVVAGRLLEAKLLKIARTDANGHFEVNDVLPDPKALYIESQVYAPEKGVGFARFDMTPQVEVHVRPPTSIALTVFGPDGKPVSGLRVFPRSFVSPFRPLDAHPAPLVFVHMPLELSERMSSTTAADGTATLTGLPRGTKFEPGFEDERFAYLGPAKRVQLSDTNAVSAAATINLEPAATITGVVRFGPTGAAAPGIEVITQGTNRSSRSGSSSAITDAKGEFRLRHVSAGEYNIMLNLDEQFQKDWTASARDAVAVAAGQTLSDVNFSLVKGGVVTGRITMADIGQPITQTRVAAHGPARPRSGAAVQGVAVAENGIAPRKLAKGE